jgi:predicted RNase H-like nuclease
MDGDANMSSYLGVDWASGCWVVTKTGDETLVTTEPSILNVWHEHGEEAEAMLVDMPIGLLESGTRACDEEARDYLGARGGTVFTIPPRPIVETEDYNEARDENGGSLGSQSWWLFPRIKEVDVCLQEWDQARDRTYESHPEICFDFLADGMGHSKDTKDGRDERLEVLEGHDLHSVVYDCLRDREGEAEWHHRISKGRRDDVLDAAAMAYTAEQLELGARPDSEYPSLPESEFDEVDECLGISPEIVTPRP